MHVNLMQHAISYSHSNIRLLQDNYYINIGTQYMKIVIIKYLLCVSLWACVDVVGYSFVGHCTQSFLKITLVKSYATLRLLLT